jgi:hypothetical protein
LEIRNAKNVTTTNVTQDVIDNIPHGRSFQSVIQFAPAARNEPLMGNTTQGGYPGNGTGARQVHDGEHVGAAVVHFFAAGALEAQDNLTEAQREMEILLSEDPKSPSSGLFRQILDQMKADQISRAAAKPYPAHTVSPSFSGPTAEEVARGAQQVLQNKKEEAQIAEAEAELGPACPECRITSPTESSAGSSSIPRSGRPTSDQPRSDRIHANISGPTLRVAVDEVAIFFTATDHGRSVTNLTSSEIQIRDNSQHPESILSFRNESELPLRLGLIIDTSNSVTDRFRFEQEAATKFLRL